ncbi:HD domain-containing phosphohydrolase [Candidatus Latescibacterota bacterium]
MKTSGKKIQENLIRISNEISEIKDLDVLMERILKAARDICNCDAGSIYIKQGNELLFSYSQNDTLSGRLKPGEKLIYSTFTIPVNDNSIAGYVANSGKSLNIKDAYNISKKLPFSFNKSVDESTNYRTHSIFTVPLKKSTGKITGILQLINSKDENGNVIEFDKKLEPYCGYFANNAAIALERAQLTRTILLRMISMAELRDPKETGNHVNRVAGYSMEIYEVWAKKKNIPQEEIDKTKDVLRMAAMLHDVGKVAISDTILKKPARFTDEEYKIMQKHTVYGARLFSNITSDVDEAAKEVALNHHERYDGKGYPGYIDLITEKPLPGYSDKNGNPILKKGEDIPLLGRIVALSDVYDALSSARVYKEAWDEDKVLNIIREEYGKQFDPEVVDAFFVCLPSIKSLQQRYP